MDSDVSPGFLSESSSLQDIRKYVVTHFLQVHRDGIYVCPGNLVSAIVDARNDELAHLASFDLSQNR